MKFLGLNTVLLVFLFVGCSVEKARVDGAPPVTESLQFKAGGIKGTFLAVAPTVFLWPEEKDGKALTYEEDVATRAEILKITTGISVLTEKIKGIYVKVGVLEGKFKSNKCGLFETDILVEEPDPNASFVSVWKVGENSAEEDAIKVCQENQTSRETITATEIGPLSQQAGALKIQFLEIMGNNLFLDFQALAINFSGTFSIKTVGFQSQFFKDRCHHEFSDPDERKKCFETSAKSFDSSTDDEWLKIRDVLYDDINGTLAFSIPAYQFGDQGESDIVGDYNFKLELTLTEGVLKAGGSVELLLHKEQTSRFGRASFSGTLNPGT